MANPYHDFTAPQVSPYGAQAAGDGLRGALQAFVGQIQQKRAQEDALRQMIQKAQMEQQNSIQLEQAKGDIGFQNQQRMNQSVMDYASQNPGIFGGMPGGGGVVSPVGGPAAPGNAQPNAGGGGFSPFMLMPDFKGGLKSVDNPAFKQAEALDTEKKKEIMKGPGAESGRVALAKEGLQSIAKVRKLLFPDGTSKSFKRSTAIQANMPGPGSVFPWGGTDVKDINRMMGTALSGRQLIQTGVAARPEESRALVAAFAPNGFSDPQAAWNGLDQLDAFYRQYLGQSDPETRFGVNQKNSGVDMNLDKKVNSLLDELGV